MHFKRSPLQRNIKVTFSLFLILILLPLAFNNVVTAADPGQEIPQDSGHASTTIVLTSSVNPSIYGQPVTFTADVTAIVPESGIPTGMVTFNEGEAELGSVSANSSTGRAVLVDSSLSVGNHSIIAVYSGDSNFAPSTSAVLAQTIDYAQNGIEQITTPTAQFSTATIDFMSAAADAKTVFVYSNSTTTKINSVVYTGALFKSVDGGLTWARTSFGGTVSNGLDGQTLTGLAVSQQFHH